MPTIQGTIIKAFEPRTGQNSRGEWMAQDFLLESFDQPYTRRCVFTVFGKDRLQQFNIKEGDNLAVDIDLDVREYNGRYYNTVRAWRAVPITPPQPEAAPAAGQPLPPPPAPIGEAATPTAGMAPMAPPPPTADPLGIAPTNAILAGDGNEDLPF